MEYKRAAVAISIVRIAASGRSRGSTMAWCAPLRRQTWRLEVVRRPLPCDMPALLTRWISGLVRLYLLQHGRQPLVVDDRAGLHGLDLVEHLESERSSVELNREPAVRVIHHFHLLARLATGQRCSGPAAASSGHSAGSGCALTVRSSRQARISSRSSAGVSGRCRSPVQARGRLLAFAGARPKRVLYAVMNPGSQA